MTASVTDIPAWWIRTEALMAAADSSFAHRPQQAKAAGVLDAAMRTKKHAALDLPVGSGKTALCLAAAEQATGRTVISTATKALQNQIRDKDEPALRAAGALTKHVVILEGRSNYACLNRAIHSLRRLSAAGIPTVEDIIEHLNVLPEKSRRDQMPFPIADWVWANVCSDTDACGVLDCKKGRGCAYTAMRNEAREADIVVVNHSLLLADADIKKGDPVSWGKKSRRDEESKEIVGVLGMYQNLIVDEAHALEGAAENFGEQRVTVRGIQSLMTRVSKHEHSGTATKHLAVCLDELQSAMLGFPVGALLTPTHSDATVFANAADAADQAGLALRARHTSFDKDPDTEVLVNGCYGLRDRLAAVDEAIRTGSDRYGPRAVSIEAPPTSARKGSAKMDPTGIKSQLVDVGPWLIEHLFRMVPTIAMSGTLAVPGKRDWVTDRIGLTAPVMMLPTSFDLRTQRLVYVTPRVEDRTAQAARSTEADVVELEKLIEASNGRALVLFPAVTDLKFVHGRMKIKHTLLGQGVTTDGRSLKGEPLPASNATLAQRFTEDTHSVLLATRSFFEGVDFPGEQCSLVVIVRFPNLRPDDPLTLARRTHIEAKGGNAWVDYQEPAMQLLFRQAAGRAIRRIDDRGVVAVIDPRSGSKQYAKTALRSLAPSDYTDQLKRVQEFLR